MRWLQSHPFEGMGDTLHARSIVTRKKLLYHTDLFTRTPPQEWKPSPLSLPKFHETITQG